MDNNSLLEAYKLRVNVYDSVTKVFCSSSANAINISGLKANDLKTNLKEKIANMKELLGNACKYGVDKDKLDKYEYLFDYKSLEAVVDNPTHNSCDLAKKIIAEDRKEIADREAEAGII